MKIRTACWITLFALPMFNALMLCGLIFRYWPLFIYDTDYNPPLQILTLYRVLWPALFGFLVTAGIGSFVWNFLKHLKNTTRLTLRDFCICFFSIFLGLIIPALHLVILIPNIKEPATIIEYVYFFFIWGDITGILCCLSVCGFCFAVLRHAQSTKLYSVTSLTGLWTLLIGTLSFFLYWYTNIFMYYLRDFYGDIILVIGLSDYIVALSLFIMSCSRYVSKQISPEIRS